MKHSFVHWFPNEWYSRKTWCSQTACGKLSEMWRKLMLSSLSFIFFQPVVAWILKQRRFLSLADFFSCCLCKYIGMNTAG